MIDKITLLELMICPACRARLLSFENCSNCSIKFTESDGTPAIFQTSVSRMVGFQFSPDRATMGEGFRTAFNYPSRRGASPADSPYHLDIAHADVIAQLPAGSMILEIGCGGGQMREYMQAKGHRYVGVDISKSRVVDHLLQYGGPEILCDAHFLPFADQSFDLIYTAAVTEHLACPFLVTQEIFRALKPGGKYLGNVSFLEPWHDDSFFHMSPLGVYELLTQAKFEISSIWPGEGYSAFTAILGDKATRPFMFVGRALGLIYRLGNRIRNLVKGRENWHHDRIEDAARVAGATDWIATRPG